MHQSFSRLLRAACTAALLAVAPHAGFAAEAPLSLAEAQRLAAERSRSLQAQNLGITASREMAVAAGQLPDPVVSVGVDNLPVEGPDRFSFTREGMTMRRIGVMQELTRKEKRELRAERYQLEAEKGVAEREMTLAMIQRETAMAWLDAWYAQAMAALIAEQRVRGLQEAQAAETQYRSGRGSQPEVLMARANLAMLDDRAAELERKVKTSRTMLSRWTGAEPAERPLGRKPDLASMKLQAHGLDEQLGRHPEIAALGRMQQVAAAEARLAALASKPDVSVQLMYGFRGSAFGDMVSLGVSMPLPWDQANRQDREVAAKLAMAGQAEAQREEALRKHVAEVQAMLQEWESNRSRIVRYEREIVPLAAGRAEATVAAFRGGKTTVNDVVAAFRGEIDARLQALQLEAEVARLWAQLNYLVPENTK